MRIHLPDLISHEPKFQPPDSDLCILCGHAHVPKEDCPVCNPDKQKGSGIITSTAENGEYTEKPS